MIPLETRPRVSCFQSQAQSVPLSAVYLTSLTLINAIAKMLLFIYLFILLCIN